MTWTPERVEECKRLYIGEGKSASEVAALLGEGVSRAAIASLAKRRGWPQKLDNTSTIALVNARRVAGTVYHAPQRAAAASAATAVAKPWMERAKGECRFPVGSAIGADLLMCCAPAKAGSDYCPNHARHMEVPPPPMDGWLSHLARYLKWRGASL